MSNTTPDTRDRAILREEIENLLAQNNRKPTSLDVVAVTKGFSPEIIEQAHDEGFQIVGENRVGEALKKEKQVASECSEQLQWHFIGHLQSNKVRKIIGFFDLLHSVDRMSLVNELEKRLQRENVEQDILVQVNVSGEESKYGVRPEGCKKLVEEILKRDSLNLYGLMTMAPLTDNETIIRETFKECRLLRNHLEDRFSIPLPELSMGMTNDYPIAIEEGATFIRLGRALFGERNE